MNDETRSERVWLNRTLQAFSPAAFLLALMLIVFPISEVVVSAWPARPAELAWRFGAMGYLSRALMTPMLGLGIAVFWASFSRNRTLLLSLTVLALLSALFLMVIAVLFILDSVQLRGQLEAELQAPYAVTTIQALVKFGFASVTMLLLAFGLHRNRRLLKPTSSHAASKASVVFGKGEDG